MTAARAWRQVRGLGPAEWRTLAAACALQILFRVLVRVLPLDRLGALVVQRPMRRPADVSGARLAELVGWSTRACGGTCLTESFVRRALAARRGEDLPVVIGVARSGGGLLAHAWTGTAPHGAFEPLWRTPGGEPRPSSGGNRR